ncbi:MAG: 7-carboxy-7-deazaguanine synthase QueE [Polyangiaceae bacterium]|nr:7-carboxy-7-deazaguanine synthase QueE [Polyangiaceae bacterium]
MEPQISDAFTLRVSEVFESLQGEGPHAGRACVFLRLALCNLRCGWCDTKYTWDFKSHSYDQEVKEQPVAELVEQLQALAPRHLVITGGEPLLQQAALQTLLTELDPKLFVEIETNGTLPPSAFLSARVQHWNVSPKLANSGESEARRLRFPALLEFSRLPGAWLKLVLSSPAEWSEAEAIVAQAGWPKERISLMPKASNRAELEAASKGIAELAASQKVRFSTRLHLLLWDGARGT